MKQTLNPDANSSVNTEYMTNKAIADDKQIDHPVALIGDFNNEQEEAFGIRFKNVSKSIFEEAKIVVVHNSVVEQNLEDISKAYKRGAIISIIEPKLPIIEILKKDGGVDLNLVAIDSVEKCEIISFTNRKDISSVGSRVEGCNYNDIINDYVAWLDRCLQPRELPNELTNAGGHYNITEYFDCQYISNTFPFSIKYGEVADVKFSKKDRWSGSGTITVNYAVYSIYSYGHNGLKGDFYIVKSNVNVISSSMYVGNMIKKHGGVHARICAFYLKKLNFKASLVDNTGNVVGRFVNIPTPVTSDNTETYTIGCTINFDANIGFEAGSKAKEIDSRGSLFSYSNQESYTLCDVSISNHSNGYTVDYEYNIDNLPKYESTTKSISEPPAIAKSNAEFNQLWIWNVSSSEDNDTNTQHYIKTEVNPTYESCHFYSTGADFSRKQWFPLTARTNRTNTSDVKMPQRC